MKNFTEAENQIITSLSWFRTRYALFLNLELDRIADQKSIEEFGKVWMGNFKCNWSDSFDSLIKKDVLTFSQGEYQFTAKGELVKKEIESKTPFFKYEYDHFFDSEKNSNAHAEFCKQVYGIDLSQHGLIDSDELSILIEKLSAQQPKSIADIGCGNGRITEYISEKIQVNITGIDISEEGIKSANNRTKENPSLLFKVGNFNCLDFINEYDAILFLDTLYYADDLKNTIEQAISGLTENGRLYAYFSQWIMGVEYSEYLHPKNTHLAKVLADLELEYSYTDLTISGINHWKKKLNVLNEMKMDFVNEKSTDLWEYRYREAYRYANWGDNKYARYLYEVKNKYLLTRFIAYIINITQLKKYKMKVNTFLLLIVLNGCIPYSVYSQITETFFSDSEGKEGGKVNDYITGEDCIIIAGNSFNNYRGEPSVTKIDTSGNVVWSTTNYDSTLYKYTNVYVDKIIRSDNFIYALTVINSSYNGPKEIWKIDASNGHILWKKEFSAGSFSRTQHFIDYDSTKFIIGYYKSSGNPEYSFLSKINGDIVSTHAIGSGSDLNFGLSTDNQLNIYYTYKNNFYKVSATNPDSTIWNNALPKSSHIVDFLNIHIDTNDNVFLFARHDNFYTSVGKGKVIAISSLNGNLIWESNASGKEIASVKYVDKGGYIYSTWRHAFVGGGSFDFWTSKMDKKSGNIEWNSSIGISAVGTSDTHSGSGEAALSLDVDDSGDVYMTGYYGDANYGPENWGILKLDGKTGNDIYELTITEDSIKYDNISVGLVACVINNNPYFIGELETYHLNNNERSKATFIKLDRNSGNIIIKKFIDGTYQFPSKTLQIEKFGTDKTVVFKQIGRLLAVELYDYNKKILWEQHFEKNYLLFGSDLIINENGTIVFSAYSVDQSSSEPYYAKQTDSIYVFKLDSFGKILSEYSFYLGVEEATPTEIINDGHNTFIFYQKSNTIHFRKLDGINTPSEHKLNIQYNKLLSHTKYAINHTDSTILIFGSNNIENKVVEIDKYSLNTKVLGTIPQIQKINFIAKNGAQHLILCGQNKLNKDVLINYNTSLLDTTWTKSYSSQSEIYKFIFNVDSSFIYSIGTQSGNVILRKISKSNGIESWSYSYNGSSNLSDAPLDLVYNKHRNQLAYTGYQSDSSGINVNKNVLIETIDTNGININTIIKKGVNNADNMGICTKVFQDGSIWIGGNINHSIYGKAGFIYELDSNFIITSNDEDYTNIWLDTSKVIAYPNPFLDFIHIKYTVFENNSNTFLSIHDIHGKTIYSDQLQNQQKGKHNLKINTAELNGMYVLRLQINNQAFTRKIVSISK